MKLRWEGDDKDQWLFAGVNETELAWLNKRAKLWEAVVWLPGVEAGKRYNTLAAHKKHIETLVKHWFKLCQSTKRPSLEIKK